MQARMTDLQREMRAEGYDLPLMGVGVSTGDAVCGEFGTAQRTDYTAMGRMMNLGARLCSAAGGGEVVISEQTYRQIEGDAQVVRLHDVSLKGIGRTTAYKLVQLGI
jgi:class 3 adenylate cyclase